MHVSKLLSLQFCAGLLAWLSVAARTDALSIARSMDNETEVAANSTTEPFLVVDEDLMKQIMDDDAVAGAVHPAGGESTTTQPTATRERTADDEPETTEERTADNDDDETKADAGSYDGEPFYHRG